MMGFLSLGCWLHELSEAIEKSDDKFSYNYSTKGEQKKKKKEDHKQLAEPSETSSAKVVEIIKELNAYLVWCFPSTNSIIFVENRNNPQL